MTNEEARTNMLHVLEDIEEEIYNIEDYNRDEDFFIALSMVFETIDKHIEKIRGAECIESCEDCQRIIKPNPYYDCISRQNTIDAIWLDLDEDTAHKVRDILEVQPSVVLKQAPCEDCVSRAEAINAISHAEISFQVMSNLNFENYKREVQEIADGILKGQIKALSDLPSVQPKEIYNKSWKDGAEATAYHVELCEEENPTIPLSVIEDIKAEIEKQIKRDFEFAETEELKVPCHYGTANGLQVALKIIDGIINKHIAESEG